ncbi:uncharacterized protein LOC8289053 [Ricinus communis]|uniref:uncharacterized protein LOC8289053 n=1 Tax=Ricinus communis TaxID=3988 RepID=UPI000772674B|nr:uncharacterized protein LOC8289053 [Ricinus communis]|eukprot:XP_015579928.1 uncharacterized protein LOC8289053 [Ricinus communis]
MDACSNDVSTSSFRHKKKPTFRNSRRNNVQDGSDTAKQVEEGGLSNSDDLNNLSTLNLLGKREDETILLSDDGETKHALLAISDKDNGLSESLAALPISAPNSFLKNKLLVLDLNGLLVDIVSCPPKGYKADVKIRRKAIFMRPFCLDFLKFCFERFEVGVWSSRIKKNFDDVIDYVMGDMKHKLLFCWDLSHCTLTQFNTLENKHKPLVFKELRRIWEKDDPELPWEKGYYNESNTLLLDDSPYKALLNPANTAVFPHSYHCQNRQDNGLGHGGDLRVYLERLVEADNVPKFIEQHPFGQNPINEGSVCWGFYLKVMSSLHPLPTTR